MIEWTAPAVVLDARPHGEADALVSVMTEEHGAHRGLARGGGGRRQAALWQQGNLVQARWIARLPDQLGTLTAEPVRAGAARVMDDPLRLQILAAACAVADGALPEREPHRVVFGGLVGLIDNLPTDPAPLETLVRWEAALLAELGYGLDTTRCAVTGTTENLHHVSPRTGRAVSDAAVGEWATRLLPLPTFLTTTEPGNPQAWRDGLRLTGHFLERDAFGHHHRPLPGARTMLYDRVAALASAPPQRNTIMPGLDPGIHGVVAPPAVPQEKLR